MMEFKTFLNFISLKSTLMNRNSHKNSLFIYSMKFLNELKSLRLAICSNRCICIETYDYLLKRKRFHTIVSCMRNI